MWQHVIGVVCVLWAVLSATVWCVYCVLCWVWLYGVCTVCCVECDCMVCVLCAVLSVTVWYVYCVLCWVWLYGVCIVCCVECDCMVCVLCAVLSVTRVTQVCLQNSVTEEQHMRFSLTFWWRQFSWDMMSCLFVNSYLSFRLTSFLRL